MSSKNEGNITKNNPGASGANEKDKGNGDKKGNEEKKPLEFVYDYYGYDCHLFGCHVCEESLGVSISFGIDEKCPWCQHWGCSKCRQVEMLPVGILGLHEWKDGEWVEIEKKK